jgi:hypothetical protein
MMGQSRYRWDGLTVHKGIVLEVVLNPSIRLLSMPILYNTVVQIVYQIQTQATPTLGSMAVVQ